MENKWASFFKSKRNLAIITLVAMNVWLLSMTSPDNEQFDNFLAYEYGINDNTTPHTGKGGKPTPFFSIHEITTEDQYIKVLGIASQFIVLEEKEIEHETLSQ